MTKKHKMRESAAPTPHASTAFAFSQPEPKKSSKRRRRKKKPGRCACACCLAESVLTCQRHLEAGRIDVASNMLDCLWVDLAAAATGEARS